MRMIWASLILAAAVVTGPATGQSAGEAPQLETVVEGLEYPWSLAFLPDGRMLVTEKPGRLRIVTPDGVV